MTPLTMKKITIINCHVCGMTPTVSNKPLVSAHSVLFRSLLAVKAHAVVWNIVQWLWVTWNMCRLIGAIHQTQNKNIWVRDGA